MCCRPQRSARRVCSEGWSRSSGPPRSGWAARRQPCGRSSRRSAATLRPRLRRRNPVGGCRSTRSSTRTRPPPGTARAATAGIVSAVQRAISAPNQYPIDHVIQTDAPINHGNSGGPLINSRGQVVGVAAQIATGNTGSDGNIGIGFAIPVNTVRTVVAQLIKKGKVEHAFIGMTAKPVTAQIARLFRLPSQSGLLVATVQPGSGAAAAGLRAGPDTAVVSGESWPIGGDLIVSADGVALSSIDQLRDLIAAKQPGQSLSLVVYRGTKKLTLGVKLGRQPSSPG